MIDLVILLCCAVAGQLVCAVVSWGWVDGSLTGQSHRLNEDHYWNSDLAALEHYRRNKLLGVTPN